MSNLTAEAAPRFFPDAVKRRLAELTIGLALVGGVVETATTEPAQAQSAAIGQCVLKYANGLPADCIPLNLSPACLTDQAKLELGHYKLNSLKDEQWDRMASRSSLPLQETHPVEQEIQDQGGIVNNNQGRQDALLIEGREIGATGFREIVSELDENPAHPNDQKYITADTKAVACGYDHIEATLDCNGNVTNLKKFASYIAFAARRLEAAGVTRFGICNEPNYATPDLFRRLYETGRRVIKRILPSAEVRLGEFSPTNRPVEFLLDTAECLPLNTPPVKANGHPRHRCKSGELVTDEDVTIHAYRFYGKWLHHVPNTNKNGKFTDYWVGFDKFKVWERVIRWAHKWGLLKTPDGGTPKLANNEFSPGPVRSRGTEAVRNIFDWIRARIGYERQLEDCTDPMIDEDSQYGEDAVPQAGSQSWDTGFNAPNGEIDGLGSEKIKFAEMHPECIEQPLENSTMVAQP